MPLTQGQTTSFKVGLLKAQFNFDTGTTQVFKLALYTASATLDATTTAYTITDEVTGTGYTAGGVTLTVSQVPTSSGTTAYIGFADAIWAGATFTARGGLIYLANGTTNPSIAVLDFGADKTATSQTFTVQFPVSTADSAIVRII